MSEALDDNAKAELADLQTKDEIEQLVLLTRLYEDDETLTDMVSAFEDKPGTRLQSIDTQKMNSEDWDNLLRQILSTPKVITL